jgi:hypothetical protein
MSAHSTCSSRSNHSHRSNRSSPMKRFLSDDRDSLASNPFGASLSMQNMSLHEKNNPPSPSNSSIVSSASGVSRSSCRSRRSRRSVVSGGYEADRDTASQATHRRSVSPSETVLTSASRSSRRSDRSERKTSCNKALIPMTRIDERSNQTDDDFSPARTRYGPTSDHHLVPVNCDRAIQPKKESQTRAVISSGSSGSIRFQDDSNAFRYVTQTDHSSTVLSMPYSATGKNACRRQEHPDGTIITEFYTTN